MDIGSDSDTSERWEDFFGSSTELVPSLLGIYDTLTDNLSPDQNTDIKKKENKAINRNNVSLAQKCTDSGNDKSHNNDESVDNALNDTDDGPIFKFVENRPFIDTLNANSIDSSCKPRLSTLGSIDVGSKTSLRGSRESLTTASTSSSCLSLFNGSGTNSRVRNNIRILSPNVQRIITHSNAVPVDTIDIDALQQQPQHLTSPACSPMLQNRCFKKALSAPCTSHKVKLSHIPLSKITGKLTQSGADLVQTFEVQTEYLNSLEFLQAEKFLKSPTPSTADDNRTPTNIVDTPFIFNCNIKKLQKHTLPKYESQEIIKIIEMEQLAITAQQLSLAAEELGASDCTPTLSRPKEFVATEPLSPVDNFEAINFGLVERHIKQLTKSDDIGDDLLSNSGQKTRHELIEAINKPLISKPIVRSSSAASASTVVGSPLLTYARTKSLKAKTNTLRGNTAKKCTTAQELALGEAVKKISAESFDDKKSIQNINLAPKESLKISRISSPENAKSKHRPLSSSSICSTSSSSSSSSDQLNSKLATSYLASVESLAESENEVGNNPPVGLSVCERACLEIVDSERSYVQDLGQVIKGYLHDWKERACLRYDELQILFSNIEEIYKFNSLLLNQLINSSMDPCRIAKCFIDLRESFDVYTIYCTSYPEAISLLTKLLQATHTNALLASTQKMLQHTLPLGSYLLKPVQRILKYHLLLDNLRKHCDVKEVLQAHEIMRQVARNIDQVKRKLEQQSRVKELSGILDGWLGPELTVLGELRQEGLLMEHNKPRLVFLFATMLIITKQKEDGRLQFKSYIHQNNLMLSEHLPGEPTSFYVIPYDEPRNQIKLTAKNRDQKRVWAQHIKGVMLEKFDIPKRVKELVYQLGDEEDRTPDRSTWKWSLHSNSSMPVYLERRNHYRRSEIRNRSKFKRKTITNSGSFDSFNEAVEPEDGNDNGSPKSVKQVTRNKTLDDNMLPSLASLEADTSSKEVSLKPDDCRCGETACHCILHNHYESNSIDDANRLSNKPYGITYKTLKERSKSVPSLGFFGGNVDDDSATMRGSRVNLTEPKGNSKGLLEIKQYTHKSMPKRIATLKKQRTSKKETSTFYMDLSEFNSSTPTTVLKITESEEDLPAHQGDVAETSCNFPQVDVETITAQSACDLKSAQEQRSYEHLSPAEKTKKEAQIILDLLKNNKELKRIYNKQQKRRNTNSNRSLSPMSPPPEEPPPRPPSRSPPPLESEHEQDDTDAGELQNNFMQEDSEEPIYESLLRNVHVPYKFSPILSRTQPSSNCKLREKNDRQPIPRPESDYVTLVYSPNGVLKKVGEELISQHQPYYNFVRNSTESSSSSSTVKRESQNSVINMGACLNSQQNLSQGSSSPDTYIGKIEPPCERPPAKKIMMRLLSRNSNDSNASLEAVSNSESSLLPRALKSIDNIAFSFGRGNRPAERCTSDVSEMYRMSILHRQGSEAVGERMAHVDYADPKTLYNVNFTNSENSLQHDSVFSLSSSSDSVSNQLHKPAVSDLPVNFEYEQDVEQNLENEFRDSAIYSDDNDKRGEPQLKCPDSSSSPFRQPPQLPPKPLSVPPPVLIGQPNEPKATNAEDGKHPLHLTQTASRSWVLQQIENFNK